MMIFNRNYLLLFFIILLVLIQAPLIINGSNSFIPTNDTLNLSFIQNYILKDTQNIFNLDFNQKIENMLFGIEIKYLPSLLNLNKIFYLFLEDPLVAYILNSISIRVIGFLSMLSLLSNCFKISSISKKYLIAFCFASLPVSSSMGLTILGQPMVALSFYNLLNSKKVIISILLLFVFSLYSEFALIVPFILFWALLYCILYYSKIKSIKFFILGIFCLLSFSLIINYPIISTLFLEGENQSYRISADINQIFPSVFGIFYTFLKVLVFGEVSVSLFISIPVLFILFSKIINGKVKKIQVILILVILFNTFMNVFSSHLAYLGKYVQIFSAFNFGRFIFLNPFLFILLYASMIEKFKSRLILNLLFLSIIILNLSRNMEFYYNTIGKIIPKEYLHIPYDEDRIIKSLFPRSTYNYAPYDPHSTGFFSFNEYFSVDLFNEIKNYLSEDENNFYVASFGIHPSVLQYNGFNTLGGYNVNYPKIKYDIISQINKNEEKKLKVSQFKYSNTLTLISSEMYNYCYLNCYDKFSDVVIENFEPDILLLKKVGVKYIFSNSEISNYLKLNTKFVEVFKNDNYPYTIFLYKLN